MAPPVLLPGSKLNAVADDAAALPMQAALPAPRSVEQLESAKQLARQNPAAVAGILRGWVGSDQPASR
jgi:flagellar M-ring protein FliF